MAYLVTILAGLSILLAFSSIILVYLPIMITAVVAAVTVLYWLNARRAFLLELDRVVLWFRLEEIKEQKATIKEMLEAELDHQINKVVDMSLPLKWIEKHAGNLTPEKRKELRSYVRKKTHEELREKTREEIGKKLAIERQADDLAFFRTLKSKKLRDRLRDYEEEKEKGLTNGKTKR